MLRHALSLFAGVFALSTAVIFIKASTLDPLLLSSSRLLLAAAVLSPWFFRAYQRHRESFGARGLRRAVLPGVVLALHFISWVVGARATLAMNASLIVNMAPLVMPFLLRALADERVRGAEVLGSLLGLAGLALLAGGDLRAGHAEGDLVCFGSMLLAALYMSLGRRNRDIPSLFLYVTPLYAVAGVTCLLGALLRGPGVAALARASGREVALVVALALVPTVVGHSLMNRAMKHFRGGVVSVCNLGQFVFSGFNAWLLFGEVPKASFWPAAALVVLGALLALRGGRDVAPASGEV